MRVSSQPKVRGPTTCHLVYLTVQIFGALPATTGNPGHMYLRLPYNNFHNRWLNKAAHTLGQADHGIWPWGGEELQPVYDAHTFHFMCMFISLFWGGVYLSLWSLFELCFTYFYSLNTFPLSALRLGDLGVRGRGSMRLNQIMAYLDLAEVKTQIAINM